MQHKHLQYYPTPYDAIDEMMRHASIKPGMRVLEPSAGDGRIVREAVRLGANVLAIELNWGRAAMMRGMLIKPRFDVWCADFLCVRFPPHRKFNRVLMNPPFSPLDVTHVLHAWDSALAEGGLLLAIITPRFLKSKTAQAARLRRIVGLHGEIYPLPDSLAKGATRKTVLLKLVSPKY